MTNIMPPAGFEHATPANDRPQTTRPLGSANVQFTSKLMQSAQLGTEQWDVWIKDPFKDRKQVKALFYPVLPDIRKRNAFWTVLRIPRRHEQRAGEDENWALLKCGYPDRLSVIFSSKYTCIRRVKSRTYADTCIVIFITGKFLKL
jgi:hypothetical protein